VTVGTIVYTPIGLATVAVVEKDSVKLSALTAPVTVPLKAGFAAPYMRLALFALIVKGALLTVSETVAELGV
jgi:hypothetical protein